MYSWLGIKERPEGFRLTEDQTHPFRKGLLFLGAAGGGCVRSLRFHDSSPYGNHGTLKNMEPATDWGYYNGRQSLVFGGTNEYSLHGNPNLAYGPFFVGAWIKPTAVNVYQGLLGNDTAGGTYGWLFGVGYTNGKLIVYIRGLADGSVGESNAVCTANEWQHVGIGASVAGYYTFYRNGVACGTYTNTSYNNYGVGNLCVGVRGPIVSNFYTGELADPIIYSRALSGTERMQLADPSNGMLSGLILPPRRKLWGIPAAAPVSSSRNLVIGGGVL